LGTVYMICKDGTTRHPVFSEISYQSLGLPLVSVTFLLRIIGHCPQLASWIKGWAHYRYCWVSLKALKA
jgi:hypothetical protein